MTQFAILITLLVVACILVAILAKSPGITAAVGGKVLAFLALCAMPIVTSLWAFDEHMERSKQTAFCVSCHVMQPYGRSLYVDDKSWIPAVHFQNNRVPRDHACFTCHTKYAMYGDLHAKMGGLHHLWVQYVTGPKLPLHLYEPFNNRECLHCHAGARGFEEEPTHSAMMEELTSNKTSCTTSGCHEIIHNVDQLKDAKFWSPGQ